MDEVPAAETPPLGCFGSSVFGGGVDDFLGVAMTLLPSLVAPLVDDVATGSFVSG